jgi:MoxR-like ATPase
MPAAAADAPATGPTRIVVAAIGDIGGSGGEEIAEAYQALAKPLPLRGGEAEPGQLRTALLAEFPHLGDAVDRIIGDLRLRCRAGVAWVRFRPLLLVGPPGVGKTRFAKRLAQLLKLGYGEVSGAGSSDDRMLRGTARGWRDAQPALPLLVMLPPAEPIPSSSSTRWIRRAVPSATVT